MMATAHIKLLLSLLLFSFSSVAQNLIPNYSFEDTLSCPDNQAQIYKAPPWFQPTLGTPDYFNECSTSMTIPNNFAGTQYPKTGKAYSGIFVFSTLVLSREYIEIPLNSALIAGKKYCVTFYVSLSDTSGIAVDAMGLYFSTISITSNDFLNFPYQPQIKNPDGNILNDKVNWMLISGEYIAGGGEIFITIGNFKDDASTATEFGGGAWPLSYYYIDDASIMLCDTTLTNSTTISAPNIFTPNNDGINDVFKITTKNITTLNCKIYNRWGILVGELTKINEPWDGRTTAGLECTNGVYYYVLTATGEDGKEYDEKGFVSLVR